MVRKLGRQSLIFEQSGYFIRLGMSSFVPLNAVESVSSTSRNMSLEAIVLMSHRQQVDYVHSQMILSEVGCRSIQYSDENILSRPDRQIAFPLLIELSTPHPFCRRKQLLRYQMKVSAREQLKREFLLRKDCRGAIVVASERRF